MKKVIITPDKRNYRYQKGTLYKNDVGVIILCSNDDNGILKGAILNVSDSNRIGEVIAVRYTDCPYEEFHGEITLIN